VSERRLHIAAGLRLLSVQHRFSMQASPCDCVVVDGWDDGVLTGENNDDGCGDEKDYTRLTIDLFFREVGLSRRHMLVGIESTMEESTSLLYVYIGELVVLRKMLWGKAENAMIGSVSRSGRGTAVKIVVLKMDMDAKQWPMTWSNDTSQPTAQCTSANQILDAARQSEVHEGRGGRARAGTTLDAATADLVSKSLKLHEHKSKLKEINRQSAVVIDNKHNRSNIWIALLVCVFAVCTLALCGGHVHTDGTAV